MKSALIVFGSALIYAGMYKGTYDLPVFDAEGELHTAARLTYTLLETHGWLPSFLAGLIVRRRGALVGALTVGQAPQSHCCFMTCGCQGP
jgi:hypothetical protein